MNNLETILDFIVIILVIVAVTAQLYINYKKSKKDEQS
jgi:hypothetical protein